MSDETSKEDVLITVTQDDIYFFYDDLLGDGTNYEGEISGPISAGKWSGKFNFNINYFENLFVDINPTITYTTTSSSTQTTKEFESYNELKNFTAGNTNLKEVVLYNREQQLPDTSQVKTLSDEDDIATIPTSFNGLFKGCTNLMKLDLRNFVMDEVIDVAEMVNSCDNLLDENIIGLNIPKAINKDCIREHILDITETSGLTKYKCKNCSYTDEYKEFNYSGSIEKVILEPGTYKLETWGGQGGNNGGKGGYSYGNITLEETKTLYIVVGGAGEYTASNGVIAKGGYNGGNDATGYNNGEFYNVSYKYYGTGGGATHIAFQTGLLSTLYKEQEDLLIVSGGGGGYYRYYNRTNSYTNNGTYTSNPGIGGGGNKAGGNGSITNHSHTASNGDKSSTSTTTGGGLSPTESTFGIAINTGGGGYEGGRGHAAGGSGYLASLLTESGGTSGVRSGNGFAKITRIS